MNFDNETSFNPETLSDGFASATVVSGTSYTVEMKIPFKTITPKADMEIGFDAQINDGKDGARQSVAAWNDTTGNGYQDTSVYGKEIAIAKKFGIALGMGHNKFMPDKNISRQDMMVLVDRAFAHMGIPMTSDVSMTLKTFADAAKVAGYAKESVVRVIAQGLVAAQDGRINPLGITNRAEAAVLLYRIYNP